MKLAAIVGLLDRSEDGKQLARERRDLAKFGQFVEKLGDRLVRWRAHVTFSFLVQTE